jgi:phenylacetate-CoA ligase
VTLIGQLIKRVTYPLNEIREGTRVLSHLRSLESAQFLPLDELHRLRLHKLRALLEHAFTNTAFYRQRFREAGITPADIRDFDDLRRLPPLTKADLVQHPSELLAANLRPSELHRTTSGGSTGTHTPFHRDNKCLDIKLAAQLRFNRWCGWDVGDKVAVIWPAFQDLTPRETWKAKLRRMLIDRSLVLYSGGLKEAVMAQLAKDLHRFAPRLIRAFPYPLAVFTEYLRDATPYRVRPTGVLTTAEPLLPHHRVLFEQVYQCPVFNCYGSRECGHTASECEAHDGLHINAECLHVEFEMEGRPVAPGKPGHLLITDLDNYGTPFVRYEIGDIGAPLAGLCSCGRTLPRMAMTAGRDTDFLYSPHDGSLVTGSICHELVADGPDVGQLQIIQDARDHLTIRVKTSCGGPQEGVPTEYVKNVIDQIFHGTMRVTFEPVESIPREKSGKYRVCINQWLKANGGRTGSQSVGNNKASEDVCSVKA